VARVPFIHGTGSCVRGHDDRVGESKLLQRHPPSSCQRRAAPSRSAAGVTSHERRDHPPSSCQLGLCRGRLAQRATSDPHTRKGEPLAAGRRHAPRPLWVCRREDFWGSKTAVAAVLTLQAAPCHRIQGPPGSRRGPPRQHSASCGDCASRCLLRRPTVAACRRQLHHLGGVTWSLLMSPAGRHVVPMRPPVGRSSCVIIAAGGVHVGSGMPAATLMMSCRAAATGWCSRTRWARPATAHGRLHACGGGQCCVSAPTLHVRLLACLQVRRLAVEARLWGVKNGGGSRAHFAGGAVQPAVGMMRGWAVCWSPALGELHRLRVSAHTQRTPAALHGRRADVVLRRQRRHAWPDKRM